MSHLVIKLDKNSATSNSINYTGESLFLSNSLYPYYKIIKQPHYGLVELIEMNTVVNR